MKYKIFNIQNIALHRNLVCGLCVLALLVSGCQPLRKKFTRKKKVEKEDSGKLIPVLDPIDYPKKIYSAVEEYSQHYSLWKVWDKDILQSIDRGESDKRQKYILGQVLGELDEMSVFLTDDRKAKFQEAIDKVRDIEKEYNKAAAMRGKFAIKKKLSSISKVIRNEYSPRIIFSE